MKRSLRMLPFVPAMLALLISVPMAAQPQKAPLRPMRLSKVQNVWVIVMENHNWTGNNSAASNDEPDLKGSPLAPYINGELLNTSAHAEQYFNPPGNHPSAPNYIWLEAGTNFGFLTDNLPEKDNITSDQHLVKLMDPAGISWKAYAEPNYPNPDYTDCPLGRNEVDASHVGVLYFADDTNNFDSQSAYCIAHVRPYSEMATDLANHNVANYNIITPNLCHDGHQDISPCADNEPADNTARSDAWLQQNVPLITNSPEFKRGGILIITWDEGEDSGPYHDGPIGLFVLSPFAKGGGHSAYANSIHYDHSSLLRSIEEVFGLQPFLGDAADPATADLRDLFDISKLRN